MNRRKVFVVITVLLVLVAFISTSSLIAEESQPVEELVRYMFVQSAHAGSFVSVAGEDNLYTFTLSDIAPQTIYFSDRPERIGENAPKPAKRAVLGRRVSWADGRAGAGEAQAVSGPHARHGRFRAFQRHPGRRLQVPGRR